MNMRSTLRVVSNNINMMAADWLAKNGGPRRYETGFSTDYVPLKNYLEKHGITFNLNKNVPYLTAGRGRPRKASWIEVYHLVDKYRLAEGLTPIMRRPA
jgi:hypothetical protein